MCTDLWDTPRDVATSLAQQGVLRCSQAVGSESRGSRFDVISCALGGERVAVEYRSALKKMTNSS